MVSLLPVYLKLHKVFMYSRHSFTDTSLPVYQAVLCSWICSCLIMPFRLSSSNQLQGAYSYPLGSLVKSIKSWLTALCELLWIDCTCLTGETLSLLLQEQV